MDLIIRVARRRHRDGLADIGLAGGRIEAIAPRLAGGATEEIDAAGRSTTPSFVAPHIQLDKVCGALNANLHFHTLVLDGVFTEAPGGALAFHPVPGPSDAEVATALATIRHRVQRLLVRHRLEPAVPGAGGDRGCSSRWSCWSAWRR